MITIEAYAKIEKGQLHLHNRRRLEEDIKACSDCEVKIIIRKRGSKSLQQLGYYWAVVLPEIRLRLTETGHRITDEKLHEAMMLKFYPNSIFDSDGVIILQEPGSTKDFNKLDFSELTEKVRQWAWESLGLTIPDPVKKIELF